MSTEVAPDQSTPRMTADQKLVVAILAFLQFTVIVDLMILAPLGALLMDELTIDTRQFGLLVSAYAFSAGASGFATAGFADRFDRKRLLLFFYAGFIGGTVLCGVAPTYETLLAARIVTGLFGGVIGSISMAIIADLFPLSMRGRVMGAVQTSFAAAQVAGLPAGIALSNAWGWHAPFLVIAAAGALVGPGIALVLKPVNAHLRAPRKENPFAHLVTTATRPAYLRVFATTTLLASGFMLMPLMSPFLVHNLHVGLDRLPLIYMVTGAFTLFMGPLAGKLADRFGKFPVFIGGTVIGWVVFGGWASLAGAATGPTALWLVIALNVLMVAGNTARMISAMALSSAVPVPLDRGAFMSINTSLQQVAGGAAAAVGGLVVTARADGTLARFDLLCFVVIGVMAVVMLPMWRIDRQVKALQPGPA